jgi:hypothetical protein
VCLVDCRDGNNKTSQHRWTFDSDIERVTWNTFDTNQYLVRIKLELPFFFFLRSSSIGNQNFQYRNNQRVNVQHQEKSIYVKLVTTYRVLHTSGGEGRDKMRGEGHIKGKNR